MSVFDAYNGHAGETTESIFTEQPYPLNLCVLNGKTIFLQWKIQYEPCDWPTVDVKTMEYMLYPDNNFLPTEIEREVNVTVNDVCNSGKKHINVTLSIDLNEYVLEHVPYLVCIITRFTEGAGTYRSEKLYLQANRNCSSTTTGKGTTYDITSALTTTETSETTYDITNILNATMETPVPFVISSASAVLQCNRSFINVPYIMMCVFVIILLDVLEY